MLSNGPINLVFFPGEARFHGKVTNGYDSLYNEYKAEKSKTIFGTIVALVIVLVYLVISQKGEGDIGFGILAVFAMGIIVAIPNVISVLWAKKKCDNIMAGEYQLAVANLVGAFSKRAGSRRNRYYKYYIEVCDERGIRAKICVSLRNFEIAHRYIGCSVALVKPNKGKGIYDRYDYCPYLFEQPEMQPQMNNGMGYY